MAIDVILSSSGIRKPTIFRWLKVGDEIKDHVVAMFHGVCRRCCHQVHVPLRGNSCRIRRSGISSAPRVRMHGVYRFRPQNLRFARYRLCDCLPIPRRAAVHGVHFHSRAPCDQASLAMNYPQAIDFKADSGFESRRICGLLALLPRNSVKIATRHDPDIRALPRPGRSSNSHRTSQLINWPESGPTESETACGASGRESSASDSRRYIGMPASTKLVDYSTWS